MCCSWLITSEWLRDECRRGGRWFITQETWWTCSQAHHCCSKASGNKGLLSELERVAAVRIQGWLGSRPLTLVRGMWPVSARPPCLEGEKVPEGHEGASVVKPSLKAEIPPWGSFTGDNITWHSRKLYFVTTCLVFVVLAMIPTRLRKHFPH